MVSQLRWGSVSITGNFRENNEDRCYIDPHGRFFLLADGMGGQSAGEKASEMAVDFVSQRLDELVDFQSSPPPVVQTAIDDAVALANREIMQLSEGDANFHNMGTTIVMLAAVAGQLFVTGVGDSRVYQLRRGHLQRLTKDHSITQALLDAGAITPDEAAKHRYRNMLYRYLGCKDGGTGTEVQPIIPEAGDRYMLCSDGVTEGVPDAQIQQFLAQHDDPQDAAATLVAAAQAGGSKDNITCVVVYVE